MKADRLLKQLVLLLLISTSLSLTQANAQEQKYMFWGLKAESNLSGFFILDNVDTESKIGLGATFGGFLNIELAENFTLQGELLYHYKASELNNTTKGDFQHWGMEIPIYAMCNLTVVRLNCFPMLSV